MARTYQKKWVNAEVEKLLNLLVREDTQPTEYKSVMYQLGRELGEILKKDFRIAESKVCIACTVEDADYLAKGIIDVIGQAGEDLFVTVFWNKRFKPNAENNISIAPILREFHDPGYTSAKNLIVLKSIIANACVVKTNVANLIEHTNPDRILIVAPVILKDAQQNLQKEFSIETVNKFEYVYFAEDTEKSANGMVIPGIGGDVYQRTGFKNQDDKNRFTPNLVKERRQRANTI